jgi:hypothetical protein
MVIAGAGRQDRRAGGDGDFVCLMEHGSAHGWEKMVHGATAAVSPDLSFAMTLPTEPEMRTKNHSPMQSIK